MSECNRFRQWMNDAVDGDLESDSTVLLESHLLSCSACRHHYDGLLSLVAAAASLPAEVEPARDLWPEIEGRLPGKEKTHRYFRVSLAVAAVALVGVALSLLRAPESESRFRPVERIEAVQAANQAATMQGVRLEYREARAELLEVVQARSGEISPETERVIERNLALIDQAIVDIETALAENPGEGRLDRHLYLAYARQIELLRWAARMPSQT